LREIEVGPGARPARSAPAAGGAPRLSPRREAMRPRSVWPPNCFLPVPGDGEEHRRRLGEARDRLAPVGVAELVRRAVETACAYEATAAMDLLGDARDAFDRVVEAFEAAYEGAEPEAQSRIECCLAYLFLLPEEGPPR
jgi:hypothetical protein